MKRPWLGVQYWENPIFMHWPVPYDTLRALVPEPFELDTFNGQAWVGVVPFKAPRTSLRWGSGLLSLGPLWQLNLRTYIHFYEKPAVYFITIYTNSRLSVFGARSVLSLPYKYASFNTHRRDSSISINMKQSIQKSGAAFSASVQPLSEHFSPGEHTLEHWLTERYHFYALKGKHIVKASISHMPWRLREVRYEIRRNNLVDFIPENKEALIHLAAPQMTYLYPFEKKGIYLR